LVFAGLYFFYDDNDLYLGLFLALLVIELGVFQLIRKKNK